MIIDSDDGDDVRIKTIRRTEGQQTLFAAFCVQIKINVCRRRLLLRPVLRTEATAPIAESAYDRSIIRLIHQVTNPQKSANIISRPAYGSSAPTDIGLRRRNIVGRVNQCNCSRITTPAVRLCQSVILFAYPQTVHELIKEPEYLNIRYNNPHN